MIVLTILKVIGIVLLVILLLILLLLGILLFVPVRYRSMGYKREAKDDYYIDLNASWFLKALRFKAVFDPEGLRMNLRFLWLTLMDSPEKDEDESEESTVSEESKPRSTEDDASPDETDSIIPVENTSSVEPVKTDVSDKSETIEAESSVNDIHIEEHPDAESEVIIKASEATTDDSITVSEAGMDPDQDSIVDEIVSDHTGDTDRSEESEEPSQEETKDRSFSEKTGEKFRTILGKIENVSEKISEIKDTINDEENRAALKLIIKNLKYLLRHYRFRRLKGNLTYGSEDPSSVGSVMMYLSLIYPVYGENFTIEPVFDRSVISGDMNLKGRIRLIHLLIAMIELMLNKKIRHFVINRL
ncbi:hypothetical protein UYO_0579 [Lachnospiraceae bacterium JC7]|nr:hypothetical protein UYO_0579 [Lachnospiraceae bacterium JC7]